MVPGTGPRLRLDLKHRLEQRLRLAPQVIQSIEILQMPALELNQYVRQQMLDNPLLEWAEPQPGEGDSEELREQLEHEERMSELEDERTDREFEHLEELAEYFERMEEEQRGFGGRSALFGEGDPKQAAMQNTARAPTLHEYLIRQLALLELDRETRRVAEEIIYSVDEDGYFHEDVETLAAGCGVDRGTAEAALKAVQSLEPPGVGARDVVECLLLQAGDAPEHEFERRLIRHHLGDISLNRLPGIVRETGEDMERVNEAVEFIRHLNPRPGALISGEPAPVVKPDVVIERVDGEYVVRVEETTLPALRMSHMYQELLSLAKKDRRLHDYLRRKYEAARRLISAVEQRRLTLYRITDQIAQMQRDFLERGIDYLRPLKMRDVADGLGVHVSTVSRAIADKWVQTPGGVFPLRFFFTGGLRARDGRARSTRSIKDRIRRMVESEDPHEPMSDDDIAERLAEQGFSVARRTVAKYRKQLGIASSRQRKRY